MVDDPINVGVVGLSEAPVEVRLGGAPPGTDPVLAAFVESVEARIELDRQLLLPFDLQRTNKLRRRAIAADLDLVRAIKGPEADDGGAATES